MQDVLVVTTCLAGPGGCDTLAQALRFNPSLTSLSLGMNSIGDRYWTLFLAFQQLSLSPPRGTTLLSRALEGNKLLISLDLRCNFIGPKGADSIARMLGGNNTLTALNLQVGLG